MKTELIKALKETVLDLRLNRKDYDWWNCSGCNCGILAQNICGMDAAALTDNRNTGSWSMVCRSTGKKLSVVLEKMFLVGMTKEDIIGLESLSDENILKEAGMVRDFVSFTDKDSVIKYMEAWLRILEREEVVPEMGKPINAAPNKPMEFITYKEMKTEMELLFQN